MSLMPIPLISSVARTLTFTDSMSLSNFQTTYTFTNRNIGVEHSTRQIIAIAGGHRVTSTTGAVSSLTVNGVNLTNINAVIVNSGGQNNQIEIWWGAVPTGTTAVTVEVVHANGRNTCIVGLFSLLGYGSPSVTDQNTDSVLVGPVPLELDVNTNAGDFVIAGLGSGSDPALSFSTGVTESFDITESSNAVNGGIASKVAAATPRTVTGVITSGIREVGVSASIG